MRMMNPSVMVSRLDLWFLELAAARIVFRRLPYGFWIFEVFIEHRGGAGGGRGGHKPPGRAWAPKRDQVGCAPLGAPLWHFLGTTCVFWSKNLSKKFRRIWTPFGIDFR